MLPEKFPNFRYRLEYATIHAGSLDKWHWRSESTHLDSMKDAADEFGRLFRHALKLRVVDIDTGAIIYQPEV